MSADRESKIYRLKSLIQDYEEAVRRLDEMIVNWEAGDPCSDPGLQYEQECTIENLYDEIILFVKTM
jgi:uncharacterized protein YbaP (TraB family)